MRITHFETFLCSYPFPEEKSWWGGQSWEMDLKGVRFNAIILRVHTDEGITGLGEPSGWGDCKEIEATLQRLEQRFAGKDPFDVEKLTVHTPDRAVNSALAAIDCALWDIIGKATDTPVYRLLATEGDYQPAYIRTYASGGVSYNWFSKPDQIFDEIAQLKAEGFTAFKMRIGSAWGLGGMTISKFGDHLARVRAALGDDIDLMLDANCRFRTVEEAKEVAHILEGLKARWFEEPIPRPTDDNDDRYYQIRSSARVPISGGEGLSTLADHQRAIRVKAYEIVQPDACMIGFTSAYRLAQMYHRAGLPCIPHSWTNAVAHACNAHLVAAIPNRVMLETQHIGNPMLTELVDHPIPVNQGFIDVPECPGLGIELNVDAIRKYPFADNGIFVPWPR